MCILVVGGLGWVSGRKGRGKGGLLGGGELGWVLGIVTCFGWGEFCCSVYWLTFCNSSVKVVVVAK